MQERTRNFKAFAGSQLNRLATSGAANRAFDLASRARGAVEQASQSQSPFSSNGQPQTWREWAIQKLPTRGPSNVGVETVHLFPGWATRRSQNRDAGFTLEVYISGFASSLRPPEQATRSQKAFMALAKRLAALPRLPADVPNNFSSGRASPASSTARITQPPNPSDQREAEEIQALNAELAELPQELRPSLTSDFSTQPDSVPLEQLRRMHANLDLRLQPFWSSSLSNRPVKLSIFSDTNSEEEETIQATSFVPLTSGRQPLFTVQTSTDAQGIFNQRISIPFETICTNPQGLSIAFEPFDTEPKLIVQAELQPAPQPPETVDGYFIPRKTIATHISIPISNRQIRVISDIDDTVKVADVSSGIKKIFNNVFVKGLEELIVPGMGTFYQRLYRKGVRFHYVSNSPYGLLSIITEFLQVAGLPPGSLWLRFYGGRSLFGGLWEPAGERKRSGVVHVLDHFPDSLFLLIGDTGEQDLDLYVQLAKERPHQIAAIYLRDVVPQAPSIGKQEEEPLLMDLFTEEPQNIVSSGASTSSSQTPNRSASTSSSLARQNLSTNAERLPYKPRSRTRSTTDTRKTIQQQPQQVPPMQLRTSFIDDEPIVPGRVSYSQQSQDQMKMTPAERRRWELDQKIALARQILPPHIIFRVFQHADECIEAFDIVDHHTQWRSSYPSNPFS